MYFLINNILMEILMLKLEINTEVEDNKGHRNSVPGYVELCLQDGQ